MGSRRSGTMRVYNPGLMDKLFVEDERAYATQEVRAG